MALPLLVLLISASNVANLVLSRGVSRAGELSVRVALGASRPQLIREQLIEAVVIGVLGGVLGILIADGLVRWALSMIIQPMAALAPSVTLHWHLEPVVFAAAAMTALVGLVPSAVIPAYILTRPAVSRVLSSHSGTTIVPRWRGKGNIIALQVSASVWLFLIALIAVYFVVNPEARRVSDTASGNGVDLKRFAIVYLPFDLQQYSVERSRAFIEAVSDEARRIPGVRAVAVGTHLPLALPWSPLPHTAVTLSTSGLDFDSSLQARESSRLFGVTGEAVITMGGRIRSGRLFDQRDTAASAPVIVLNEDVALAMFGTTAVVGRTLFWRHDRIRSDATVTRSARIIGVLETASPSTGPKTEARVIFAPFGQTYIPAVTVAVRTALEDASSLVRPLEAAVHRLDPDLAISASGRADELAGVQVLLARLVAGCATMLALISLLLSMTGLYGVMSHMVGIRMREMGLRMALGATRGGIVRLVVTQGLRPIAEGIVIGIGGALLSRQLVVWNTADVVPAISSSMLALTILPLVLVAIVACYFPAHQAAHADPGSLLKDV